MSLRRIEVTYSTMGQSSPASVESGGYYKYRGDSSWVPNDPRYRDGGDLARQAAANAGGAVGAEARRRRLADFADALADLGEPDPAEAPNAKVTEAGRRVGVTAKTAKSYRTAIKKQQQREKAAAAAAAGVAEDAEPGEIVAKIHEQIAGFSARHATLVAAYRDTRAAGRVPPAMKENA